MKTRWLLALLAPCLLATGVALAAPPQDWTGNVNLVFGTNMLENDWDPVDNQASFGVLLDFRRPHWPLNLAVDLLFSWDDDSETVFIPGPGVVNVDVTGRTTELDLGVRKLWEDFPYVNNLTPYVGGGLAVVWATQQADGLSVDEDESGAGFGLWGGGGAYFTLGDLVNLGVDLRYTRTNSVELIQDVNTGGFRASVLAGLHW